MTAFPVRRKRNPSPKSPFFVASAGLTAKQHKTDDSPYVDRLFLFAIYAGFETRPVATGVLCSENFRKIQNAACAPSLVDQRSGL